MKIINNAKRWGAIIALSMLNPACTHAPKATTQIPHHQAGHKKSLPVNREALL